jgi:hypothetical protein
LDFGGVHQEQIAQAKCKMLSGWSAAT